MGDKKCIKPLAFGGPRYGTMSCEMSFLVKMYVFISGGSCRPPNFSQYCYALLEKMEEGEMGRLDFISFHQKGGNLAEDQIDVVRRLSGKYQLQMFTTYSLHTACCSYVRVTICKSSLPPNDIHEIRHHFPKRESQLQRRRVLICRSWSFSTTKLTHSKVGGNYGHGGEMSGYQKM